MAQCRTVAPIDEQEPNKPFKPIARENARSGLTATFGLKMVDQTDIMPMLLEACPSFRSKWEQIDADEKRLVYICLGEFAHHLLALYRAGSIGEFASVSEAIERLHVQGSPAAQEAATIGLLEAIQNVWGNNGVDPELFKPFLKEQSGLWWEQLNLFWQGAIPYVGATMPNKTMEPTR